MCLGQRGENGGATRFTSGKACQHQRGLWKTEKARVFNSSWRGSYASSRRQVTLRKLTDRSLLCWVELFPKPRDSVHLGKVCMQFYETVLNRWSGFLYSVRFLHYIGYCIVAEQNLKVIYFPVWLKLSSLILSTFLGPTFLSSLKNPPGRCLSTVDLSWIWKIVLHAGLIMQTTNLFLE